MSTFGFLKPDIVMPSTGKTHTQNLSRPIVQSPSGFLTDNQVLARAIPPLVLLVACLAVYWPIFHHGFLRAWDDQWVVQNPYTELGFVRVNMWDVLTQFYHGQYSPVNEYYYMLIYLAKGYNPAVFHAASLLLHFSNTLLVYYFVQRVLIQSRSFSGSSVQRISFLTALLFSVHPFLVEAVAWLSASKILVYSFFYLLALHAYLSYIQTKQWRLYFLTILLFVFSFGGKEQAVTMPCALLLLDYVSSRNLGGKRVWLEKAPFFGLSLLFGYVTFLSQKVNGEGMLSHQAGYPFYQNIVFGFYSLTEYITKCLFPIRLSFLYPFPNTPGEPMPIRFWIYPVITLFCVFSLWNFWKQRWVFFGIAFFLIHIGITLNFIPTARYSIIADRYVYLASVGIFFLLAYFFDKAITLGGRYQKPLLGLYALYIGILGIYGGYRVTAWRDADRLKAEIREVLLQRGDYQQHIDAY